MENATWIVVANSTEARIFKLIKFPKIEEIETLIHPEGHLHNQDLVSSKPGRAFQSTNTARSAYEPRTEPKQVEVDKFARTLGEHIGQACEKKTFDRLYLFAETSFLGSLRPHLSERTKGKLIVEEHKDLTKYSIRDIEKAMEEATL